MSQIPLADLRAMLNRIPLLHGLEDGLLDQLAGIVRVHNYPRRSYVIHKGSAGDEMFFVLSGKLQVVDASEDGHEVGINMLEPDDFFGELSLIDGLPRAASVIAVSESLIAFLPKSAALKLFFHHPLVAERMLRRLSQRLRAVSNYRTLVGIPHAFPRIYELLRQFAKQEKSGVMTIENVPTHQQLAIMANTSRETVTRALRVLIRSKVLAKDQRRLIVLSPEKLQMAAAGVEAPASPEKSGSPAQAKPGKT